MRYLLTIMITLASIGNLMAGPGIDLTFCRAQWSFSPDKVYISGKVLFNFKSTAEPISSIDFDLSNHLRVDKVMYHNTAVPFKHKANQLVITLPGSITAGVVDSIEIEYSGKPVASSFGSIGFDKTDRIAWTLSEPYGARDWWPCRQNLLDKIDSMDIYVTCPAAYKVAANGLLQGYTEAGDQHTAHYQVRHPINYYTVGLAVGQYDFTEGAAVMANGDRIGIVDYYYQSMNYNMKNSRHIANFLNFFSDYWCTYPFADEKYGQAFIKGTVSFESQTMSVMSQSDIGTMAHELAHQWFGNYVTCKGWQNVWINEAFATFAELLMIEKFYSDLTIGWKDYTINSALTAKRAIFAADTTNPSILFDVPTTYSKSAITLLMLRSEIGADAFQKGTRAILEKFGNGFATIDDARQCFEAAADTSLADFFNRWIHGIGYPIYKIISDQKGADNVTITIKQTTSHPSVKFYPLHVTVRLIGGDNEKDVRLYNTEPVQQFVVPVGFKIENVIFDPEREILCKWSYKR